MKSRVFIVVALAAVVAPASAGAGVGVWFLRAGEPVRAARGGTTIQRAVEQLLAGPTAAEQRRGLRSDVPPGTLLNAVTVSRRVVTVDVGPRFAAGRDQAGLQARVGQLVRTVRGVPGVVGLRLLIDGGVPVGLFPGYDLQRVVTTPVEAPSSAPTLRELQQRLVDLGFLAQSGVNGVDDSQTQTAVLGFEKWAGLPRDGMLGKEVEAALLRATRPEPALRARGRRIEVQLRRQVALLIQEDKVVRTVHISSGAGGKTPTGTFAVYRKERYSWSVPFKVWLPWASYFTGGVAFHEFGSVPTYAASHGCIRVNHYDAAMLFGFAEAGTRVDVFDEATA